MLRKFAPLLLSAMLIVLSVNTATVSARTPCSQAAGVLSTKIATRMMRDSAREFRQFQLFIDAKSVTATCVGIAPKNKKALRKTAAFIINNTMFQSPANHTLFKPLGAMTSPVIVPLRDEAIFALTRPLPRSFFYQYPNFPGKTILNPGDTIIRITFRTAKGGWAKPNQTVTTYAIVSPSGIVKYEFITLFFSPTLIPYF